jgi:hypothetical protein
MIPKSVQRFPACAKPRHDLVVWTDASAGVGRSKKIMRNQRAGIKKAKQEGDRNEQ